MSQLFSEHWTQVIAQNWSLTELLTTVSLLKMIYSKKFLPLPVSLQYHMQLLQRECESNSSGQEPDRKRLRFAVVKILPVRCGWFFCFLFIIIYITVSTIWSRQQFYLLLKSVLESSALQSDRLIFKEILIILCLNNTGETSACFGGKNTEMQN